MNTDENKLQKEIERLKSILTHWGISHTYDINKKYGRCKECGCELGPYNTPGICGSCEW